MKRKIKIKCILKNGQVIKDSFPVKKSDTRTLKAIEQIRADIENYLAHPGKYKENAGCLTWGKSIILMSEIAAVSFKD
jgi:hypothetical protein